VLFAQDNGGDRKFSRDMRYKPDAKPAAGKEVPDARNLTAAQGVRGTDLQLPKNDPDVFFVRHQRSRTKLARSLQGADIDRRTPFCADLRIAGWNLRPQGPRWPTRDDKAIRKYCALTLSGFTELSRVAPVTLRCVRGCQ